MNENLRVLLTNKVLCADVNGAPIPITSVAFREQEKDNNKFYVLEMSGEAKAYLVKSNDPSLGAVALPEPVPVTIQQNTEGDASIQLRNLSKALGLHEDDALDGTKPDWLDRFDEDHPRSVIPSLKERGIFVKTTLKQGWDKAVKYGDTPFYFNPFSVPHREPVDKTKIAAIKAKIKAKMGGEMVDIA